MAVPKVNISFRQLATDVVARSSRGVVALLLSDATKADAYKRYRTESEISKEDWTEENIGYMKMALLGASEIMAVRILGGDEPDITATLNSIKFMAWNWVVAPGITDAAPIVAWIKDARTKGMYYKTVVSTATPPDSAGVVNFTTPTVNSNVLGADAVEYTAQKYTARIAGVLAGIPLTMSVTGYALDDIIGAPETADPDKAVADGELILMFNGTGYEIASGVTSLKTISASAPELLKKIKHIEGVDMVATDYATMWKANYKGKKPNTYDNKMSFVAQLTMYNSTVAGSVLNGSYANAVALDLDATVAYLTGKGVDVSTMTNTEILQSSTGDHVFINASLQLLDAMENVDIAVNLS